MTSSVSIFWFRQDLRLADNPALIQAARSGRLLPIYIYDNVNPGPNLPGAARRCWLHHSLQALDRQLGGKLRLYRGDPLDILARLTAGLANASVYWNRCYEPWQIQRDRGIKLHLKQCGIPCHSSNGSLLWEPWQVHKADGAPYQVFTPFYRNGCLQSEAPRLPLSEPQEIVFCDEVRGDCSLEDLNLLPPHPWHQQLAAEWTISEQGAKQRMQAFVNQGLSLYRAGRDYPATPATSGLSPYLHQGQLSPNQIWYAAAARGDEDNTAHLQRELVWREFSYGQLYHQPHLPTQNLRPNLDGFPWRDCTDELRRWQQGQTGHPLVDAGMRELWHTGYMHNRVRMVVASFLVKNLMLHWKHGERWFWDCLVDADLASNSANWQWVAGCGADAAPYFRIFNPATQGKKFDAEGQYTRQWIPELGQLPSKYLFQPWTAPDSALKQAGVKLGSNYPLPIIDLKSSRERALAAYKQLNESR